MAGALLFLAAISGQTNAAAAIPTPQAPRVATNAEARAVIVRAEKIDYSKAKLVRMTGSGEDRRLIIFE